MKKRARTGALSLPQTTTSKLFTVSGKVRILDIIGQVKTVIQAQANSIKLIANPTVGADVDLCAALDINADAVGTKYNITGDLSDALQEITNGAGETLGDYKPVIVDAGTIDLNATASNTGEIEWTVIYEPIDRRATIRRYSA